MKHLNFIKQALCLITFMMLITNALNAQPPHWRVGGNNGLLPDPVVAGPNILGTNIAGATLNIRTGGLLPGNTRMFIADGGTGFANGFIGICNNFLAPQNRLHLHQGIVSPISFFPVYAQWTNSAAGGATASDGLLVGLSVAGNAQIIQQENILA